MKPELMTVEEAAAAMGKHPVTVRRLIATGTLESVKEGGRVFVPRLAVEDAMAKVCASCGTIFKPARYIDDRERYCSDACRWAAVNAKRKTGRPMGRPCKPPAPRAAPDPAKLPDRLRALVAVLKRGPK